ncbi:ABC transporter ATP-binding protein [Amorphus sp. 3PC139-8]
MRFEEVSHRYRTATVLDHVSFSVDPGQILCLLGPSGCGKTTLLRLAAGVEPQSEGRIYLDGEEVAGPAGFVPAEARGLGLVFQDYALFPHLTVLENVLFGMNRRDRSSSVRLAREALDRMGLVRYMNAYPNALSGGEQQRVALVRALMPRPRVLLMDEPFSGLDRTLRQSVRRDALALLRETGSTAVIVTHDPEEAMQIGDRIVLLRAGHVIQVGPPEQLYRRPVDLQTARFFSELNEIPALVQGGVANTPLGEVPAGTYANGEPVVVAVRPHGIRVHRGAAEGVRSTVLDRRFLGEIERFELSVAGIERPIVARIPVGFGPALSGEADTVGVSLDPEAVLVFSANAG